MLNHDNFSTSSNGYRSDDSFPNTSARSATTSNGTLDGLLEWDVICERSRRASAHPGNQRYQALVRDWRVEYQSTKARQDKTAITRFIIQHVQSEGGRFVSFNKASCLWEELDLTAVHEKVTHALRSGSEEKKQQKKIYLKLRAASAKQRDEATATTAIFNFNPILPQKQQQQELHSGEHDNATQKGEDVLLTKPMNIIQVPIDLLFNSDVTPIEDLNFEVVDSEADHDGTRMLVSSSSSKSYLPKRNSVVKEVYRPLKNTLLQSLDEVGVEIMKEIACWRNDEDDFNSGSAL